jgi:hypothetical protein
MRKQDRRVWEALGSCMAERMYIVKFKPPGLGTVQTVVAATVEVHDEHLIFCNSEGDLRALFLLEVVQSWNEVSATDMTDSGPPRA